MDRNWIMLAIKPRLWLSGGVWKCANYNPGGFFKSGTFVEALGLTPQEAYWRWQGKSPVRKPLALKRILWQDTRA